MANETITIKIGSSKAKKKTQPKAKKKTQPKAKAKAKTRAKPKPRKKRDNLQKFTGIKSSDLKTLGISAKQGAKGLRSSLRDAAKDIKERRDKSRKRKKLVKALQNEPVPVVRFAIRAIDRGQTPARAIKQGRILDDNGLLDAQGKRRKKPKKT